MIPIRQGPYRPLLVQLPPFTMGWCRILFSFLQIWPFLRHVFTLFLHRFQGVIFLLRFVQDDKIVGRVKMFGQFGIFLSPFPPFLLLHPCKTLIIIHLDLSWLRNWGVMGIVSINIPIIMAYSTMKGDLLIVKGFPLVLIIPQ